jgi:hypothetical protein
MNRKERYSKENIKKAVQGATCIKEALVAMGLRAAGGNYRVFNKYVDKYEIDTSHFDAYETSRVLSFKERIPLSEILVENSTYSRTLLKKRLYDEGLKDRFCEMPGCDQGEMWMGKKMSLILDHINGVHDDNRIENLRIVCPNCNATLPTHCGKNSEIDKKKKECIDCGTDISKTATRCHSCSNKHRGYSGPKKEADPDWRTKPKPSRRVVKRPPPVQLQQEIKDLGYSATGRKYGVSDNAVRKWVKSYEKYGE